MGLARLRLAFGRLKYLLFVIYTLPQLQQSLRKAFGESQFPRLLCFRVSGSLLALGLHFWSGFRRGEGGFQLLHELWHGADDGGLLSRLDHF